MFEKILVKEALGTMRLIFPRIVRLFVNAALVALMFFSMGAQAQDSGSSGLQQILQGLGGQMGNAISSSTVNQPGTVTLHQSPSSSAPLPPSRLEQIMSSRAGVNLTQFGYDQLGSGSDISVPQTGAVQDSYVLGPGDEVVVSLRGQENNEYSTTVDRNGQVVLPHLPPILAAGRTMAEFRAALTAAGQRAFVATQIFVSLGQLRQIGVTVAGAVNNPGVRLVTGLSTPIDAILLSGGIAKTGSLRNVKLVRAGQERTIDLYSYLTQRGSQHPILLNDGDRVVVPPLGPTVAVTGWVRRPGIYELAADGRGLTARSLISLAGGTEVRGRYRMSILRVEPNGSSSMAPAPSESAIVRDSEILFVEPGASETEHNATLAGGTALSGQYSIEKATRLSTILSAPGALGQHPYTLFGIVVRRDPITKLVTLIPFTPLAVLQSREDMELYSNDVVRVFTAPEERLLSTLITEYQTRVTAADQSLRSPLEASTQQLANAQNSSVTAGAESDRQIIADLSQKTLGDGGVLSDSLPTNEYPPNGLSSDQRNYLLNAMPPVSTNSATQPASTTTSSSSPQNSQIPSLPVTATSSLAAVLGSQEGAGSNSIVGSPLSATAPPTLSQIQPSAALPPATPASTMARNFQDQNTAPDNFPSNWEIQTFGQLVRQLHVDPLVLMHFLLSQHMSVSGAVLGAGNYLIGPNVTLEDVVAASGGTDGWADLTHVEFISTTISPGTGSANTEHKIVDLTQPAAQAYQVHPHDELRLSQIYSNIGAGSVTLQGQVHSTGTYNIERGERLSDLLLRAGGLTDVAYPYGTVFLRKSAAAAERDGYRRAANEMQNIIVAGLSRIGQDKISPDAFTALNSFTNQLRNSPALGRISIVADPALLASDPTKDPILEAGDVIFIPQRPNTVTVLGQVNQPGTYLFSSKGTVDYYIDMAGGFSALSDPSLTFVVMPDGTARPANRSWLNFDSETLPPGSTIVVQRDVAPIDTRQLILDLGSILQSLAISAASLAVLNNK